MKVITVNVDMEYIVHHVKVKGTDYVTVTFKRCDQKNSEYCRGSTSL